MYLLGWSRTESIIIAYWPWMIDDGLGGAVGGMNGWQGKLKYSGKTCASAALFPTNPT
jgi:hypothetical protein